MAETPEHLVERLRSEGKKTEEFFHSLNPEHLDQPIYTDGTHWAPRQVLVHLVATEKAFHRLVENILAGGPGSTEDFDLNAYNERKVGQNREAGLEDQLEQFRIARESIVSLVNRMQPSDLQRSGRHPFLGLTTLEEIIKMIYRHNQIHQREIRKAVATAE